MARLLTHGELLAGRRLVTERLRGSWRYAIGQHRAELLDPDDADGSLRAAVSYVDVSGHACLLVCLLDYDGWQPETLTRAGIYTPPHPPIAAGGLRLSESMLAALDAAERRAARPPSTREPTLRETVKEGA